MTMTLGDVARVLALAQSYDNRKVDEIVVASWHKILHRLDFDEAVEAVSAHYATTRDWLMPVDILRGAKLARRQRLAALEKYPPNADPDDPKSYIRALRTGDVRQEQGTRALPRLDRVFRAIPPSAT